MNHDFRPVRIFVLSATSFVFTAVVTLLAVIALATCAGNSTTASASRLAGKKPANPTMRAFASEDEMKAYFRKLAEEQKRVARRSEVMASPAESVAINQAAAPAAKAGADKDEAESITNTQHAGVDEGGIVKLHGDHRLSPKNTISETRNLNGSLAASSCSRSGLVSGRTPSWNFQTASSALADDGPLEGGH